jgi:hypothetical protein
MPDLFVSEEKEGLNQNDVVDDTSIAKLGVEEKESDKTNKPSEIFVKKGLGGKPSSLREMDTLRNANNQVELPEGSSGGPVSAFNYNPKNVNFVSKDPEEKVILFLRRHPITNLPWVVTSFIIIILPSFLTVMPFFEKLPPRFGVLSILIWYLFCIAYIFERFLDWFFSVNIVTDERIFDVDFYNLAYRKMTDANIDQIQDVTVQIGGGMRTMFNFGDVLIQTAAEVPEIEFEAIPQPDKVAKILRELRVQEEIEKLEGRVR